MTDRAWSNPSDITYCVGSMPAEWAAAMRHAFGPEVWAGKSAAAYREVDNIFDAAITASYGDYSFTAAQTTYNNPTWDNTGEHPGQVKGFNLIMVSSRGPTGQGWNGFDLNRVLAHEVGHANGLIEHSTVTGALMFGDYFQQPPNGTPQQNDDLSRFQAIYPGTQPMPDQMTLTLNGVTKTYLLTEQGGGESPDGTQITAPTAATITDSSGAVWSFGTTYTANIGYDLLRNGQIAGGGQGIILGIKSHVIYTKNEPNIWYSWNGSSWAETSNPF